MRLTVLVALLVGCSQATPTPIAPQPSAATVPAVKPALDQKAKDYKDRMGAFIEEARALASLIDTEPTPADYQRRLAAVTDSFTRIPEAPPKRERLDACRDKAKNILGVFQASTFTVRVAADAARNGLSADRAKIMAEFRATAKGLRKKLTELETEVANILSPS